MWDKRPVRPWEEFNGNACGNAWRERNMWMVRLAPKANAGLALGASAALVILGLSVLFLGGGQLPGAGPAQVQRGDTFLSPAAVAFSAPATTLGQISSPGSSSNEAVLFFSSAGAVLMTAGALLLAHQRLLSRFLRAKVTSHGRRRAASPVLSH